MTRSADIVLLIGAGASVEASIPASATMISQVEGFLATKHSWKPYEALYNHLKSAIHYAAGLRGKFGAEVPFNIETLVNTLYELERNETHPLYPFIAAWNFRLLTLAGSQFERIRSFRLLLLEQLRRWMTPDDSGLAHYYSGIIRLQRDLNFPLRTFSLNYDLCIEKLQSDDFLVETGFPGVGPNDHWEFERFEEAEEGSAAPQIYLYKLHGSINWKRTPARDLFCVEQIQNVEPESMEIIFGRDFKLEAADPYLFYAYELRRWSLNARIITTIGYGFGDEHINKILQQSMLADPTRRLLVIANCSDRAASAGRESDIASWLDVPATQIIVEEGSARQFLSKQDVASSLVSRIPPATDSPF